MNAASERAGNRKPMGAPCRTLDRSCCWLNCLISTVRDAGACCSVGHLISYCVYSVDERGWRDFFDSQIYHSEPEDEHRSPTKTFSGVKNRDLTPRTSIAATRSQLQRIKGTAAPAATTRSDRYRTIRERIDRAATEAAIDEAESFNEFWQL